MILLDSNQYYTCSLCKEQIADQSKEWLSRIELPTSPWRGDMLPLHHNHIKLPYSNLQCWYAAYRIELSIPVRATGVELHSSLRFSGVALFILGLLQCHFVFVQYQSGLDLLGGFLRRERSLAPIRMYTLHFVTLNWIGDRIFSAWSASLSSLTQTRWGVQATISKNAT